MDEPAAKKVKVSERVRGVATIKPEFRASTDTVAPANDDFAEEGRSQDQPKQKRGANKSRDNRQQHESIRMCPHTVRQQECPLGENCKFEHDVEKYLASKPADLPGMCPVYEKILCCPNGIKCRWYTSHPENTPSTLPSKENEGSAAVTSTGEVNVLSHDQVMQIAKSKVDLKNCDLVMQKMGDLDKECQKEEKPEFTLEERKEYNSKFFEGVLKPTEKRRLHLSGAKILSPLTTVGNLPYRRLMKTLGADVTYGEMALSQALVQGHKSEWALVRAHESELPTFGAQIAANKPLMATKAAKLLSEFAPNLGEINLNCGCPIDLVFKQGAGSALMDAPGKTLKIVKAMNHTSGEVPITVKMRTGTKDSKPSALNLVNRLVDEQLVGAVTVHGRSRQQRYTKDADWSYIKAIADAVKAKRDEMDLKTFVIGNGDIYSHEDWYAHLQETGVDSCMVARGALVKPWIFEEIEAKQYLDKSASERLEHFKTYTDFGLQHWGSDEYGVQQTRRFLCEFLSFTRRYVPVGVLEYLPPKLNDRAEQWLPRNELEGLLASSQSQDWIKITEMFLGKAPESFKFEPKHKSTS